MNRDVETLSIVGRSDEQIASELRGHGLRLTPAEARHLTGLIGRDPTKVEATLFDIMWSEHCSYKSSRHLLKKHLPTRAGNVVLGPGEDAGIIRLCDHEGETYCLVVAHESHNHPSQVMPFEGAATGIGGIVRDVYCMGADVCAVMDALRFGDPDGEHKNKVREVASGVVSGIWQYGNALGVANMGGDVCFDSCYDENCLVNVIAMGVVREREIVRSRVPAAAAREDYDLILFGKPTDASGFGGASFASDVLDSDGLSESRAAVQVPDPFLKRILAEANKKMLELVRSRGLEIGFKDLGAGGIACATSEIVAAGGFGALIDISTVPVDAPKAGGGLPPEVIVCSETQERFVLAVPSSVTPDVLRIYNDDFELPHVYQGARAAVIGRVTRDGQYRIVDGSSRTGESRLVCGVEADVITSGITARRPSEPHPILESEPELDSPADLSETLLSLVASPNGASRWPVFSFYDCEVGGLTVVRPGDADAGVFAPVPGSPVGVAVSVDGLPSYGKISPYWAGAHAVAESMRNVACVGAAPRALSDCLNFGSPEDPVVFHGFEEALRGIGDAARRIWQLQAAEETEEPVPIVTGNVSFYNQTGAGKAVAASPIVACYGVMSDFSKAVTMGLKRPGSFVVMAGQRRDELGGSLYYGRVLGRVGRNVPVVRFDAERAAISLVLEAIDRGLLEACHDISAGGLAMTLAEMCMASRGPFGVTVDVTAAAGASGLSHDRKLFSETPGFVMEVAPAGLEELQRLADERRVRLFRIGAVSSEAALRARNVGRTVMDLNVSDLKARWSRGLERALA